LKKIILFKDVAHILLGLLNSDLKKTIIV